MVFALRRLIKSTIRLLIKIPVVAENFYSRFRADKSESGRFAAVKSARVVLDTSVNSANYVEAAFVVSHIFEQPRQSRPDFTSLQKLGVIHINLV
jgi:hypothetical protein